MKKIKLLLMSIILLLTLLNIQVYSDENMTITWSEVKTFTYSPLHPFTLNWSGNVLDRGGVNLRTNQITTNPTDTDIVINQYKKMGANGIIKLDHGNLEDENVDNFKGFTNSLTIENKGLYLVILSDGKYAKIKIESILPETGISHTKVIFSYVIEKERKVKTKENNQEPFKNENIIIDDNKITDEVYPFSIYLRVDESYAVIFDKLDNKYEYQLNVPAFIYESRTMVPIRFIAEALGAKVSWNQEERAVTIINNDTKIILKIDSDIAIVNDISYKLDVPAFIIDGNTVIPLRFVSEHLNMYVYYNNGLILITDTMDPNFEKTDQNDNNDFEVLFTIWDLWVPGSFVQNQMYIEGADAGF